MNTRVVLIDNYDSFTYNLSQHLEELGSEVVVRRNDEIDAAGVRALSPTHLVVSPGPGGPEDAGVSCDVVRELAGEMPILGVCLGHQVIGSVMGGRVVRGPAPVHGKTSLVRHDGRTIFRGLPNPLEATRYHSLVVDRDSLPDCLEITGTTDDGLVMGLRHRELSVEGVQFHPESILTGAGKKLLENFLASRGGLAAQTEAVSETPGVAEPEALIRKAIEKLACGRHLSRSEAYDAALAILEGDVPDALIAGLLVGLKAGGETAEEIAGFAEAMREVRVSINPRAGMLVDTCGTGGDRKGTFNISTTSGLIAAAAGASVAKHGNRGVSSGCGSADVLEALGVDIEMAPDAVSTCIEQVGIGFMFAPGFHPAMRRVMGARKALGTPTIFNILGPLTNPAGARAQVLGVNSPGLVPLVAEVLAELGTGHAFVLHGTDGMDEFTLAAETMVCEVADGGFTSYVLEPQDLGMDRSAPAALAGGGPEENADTLRRVLGGQQGPRLDVCLANAGFALAAAGVAGSVKEGVGLARDAVSAGEAARVLERLVAFSREGARGVS
jgi:anthranilate synthase/phosphoribosyltransferase